MVRKRKTVKPTNKVGGRAAEQLGGENWSTRTIKQ